MPKYRARLWPPGKSPIRTLGWASVIGLLGIAMLAPASPALSNDTPGNNGTVKIHEGAGENDPGEVRNEPHVCTFHLHFYFADPEQAGTWEIQEWSPGDKGTVVLSGTYDTQGDGEDRQPEQGVYTLDPGHYKLFWDGDLDTEKHDKMKVFWVDCETTTETTTTTESPTTTSETSSVSETTTGSETSSVSETTTESPTTTETSTTTESPTTSETSSVSETTTGSETSTGTETSSTTTSFSQTVSGTTTSTTTTGFSQTVSGTTTAGPTQPNTATSDEAAPVTGGSAGSLLIAVFAFLVGSFLVLVPARRRNRE
jgi:hypothetical protein